MRGQDLLARYEDPQAPIPRLDGDRALVLRAAFTEGVMARVRQRLDRQARIERAARRRSS